MGALDGFFVDRVDFLPQIFGGCGDERSSGIDVPGDFENSRPDCGEDCLDDPDHSVVERMHRANCLGFADAARHERLDAARLDLDINSCPVADDSERLREGRNVRTVSKRELVELRCRQLGDRPPRRSLRVPRVNDWIVVNDDNSVAGGVDVELNSIGPQLDGALERGEGVLGMSLVSPPVSDPLGRVASSSCGQAFLGVVVLYSMSAKL